MADLRAVAVRPQSVTIKPDQWNQEVPVRLRGENDASCVDRSFIVSVTAESGDPQFACLEGSISGIVSDDGDASVSGKGEVCTLPDGTVRYMLTIEYDGRIALSAPDGLELSGKLPEPVTARS